MIFSVRHPFYHTTRHWEVRTLNEEKKEDRREAGLESRESHLRSPYNHNKPWHLSPPQGTSWAEPGRACPWKRRRSERWVQVGWKWSRIGLKLRSLLVAAVVVVGTWVLRIPSFTPFIVHRYGPSLIAPFIYRMQIECVPALTALVLSFSLSLFLSFGFARCVCESPRDSVRSAAGKTPRETPVTDYTRIRGRSPFYL